MSRAQRDNQVLFEIAALLLSLAAMALYAGYLPFARRLVLDEIMRQAEFTARRLAFRVGLPAAFVAAAFPHSNQGDCSLHYAISLRMMAVAVLTFAVRARMLLAVGRSSGQAPVNPCLIPTDAGYGDSRPLIRRGYPFARDGPCTDVHTVHVLKAAKSHHST